MARGFSVFSKLVPLLLVGMFVLLAIPAMATAADPPSAPKVIRQENFDSTLASDWTLRRFELEPVSLAYWGRMTNIKRSGTHSLWCAGAQYDAVTLLPKTPSWGSYPTRTRGMAILDVSQLDDYYYSELSFYYNMPSLGKEDEYAFGTSWSDGVMGGSSSKYALTSASAWVPVTHVLASAASTFNMSRHGGELYFNFFDIAEGPLQSPKTGQGASLDDVTVSGYRYGPVRNLSAVGDSSDVVLTWGKPYEAIGSTTQDARSLTYRVWRAVDGANPLVWTELTGARLASTDYTDASGTPGVTYRYLVQAWDVGTGEWYGEATQTTGRRLAGDMDAAIVAPNAVLTGGTVSINYRISNTGGTTLTDIALTDNWSGSSPLPPIASLAPGAAIDVPRTTPALTSNTTVGLTATASGGSPVATNSRLISVYSPGIQVTVSPSLSTVVENVQFTAAYTITNTGNATLTNISVTDGLGGDVIGTIGTLVAGDSEVLYADVSLASSGFINAYVVADYSVVPDLAGTVNDAGQSPQVSVVSDTPPVRIAGATRITTAVDISEQAFPGGLDGANAVVLANSGAWADALPASALAGAVRGPLMLASSTGVSTEVMTELTRLGADKVYLVGGESVLSAAVRTQLQTAGYSVVRLGGSTRYDTAQLISAEVNKVIGGNGGGTVFLVTGADFPDALSASSLAARMAAPILLTKRDALPSATDQALVALRPDRVIVCGGASVVSDAVLSAVYSARYGLPTVVRKAGSDRYATARIVNQYGIDTLIDVDPQGVFIATGTNYPDALAGGVIAGVGAAEWRPLMLTKSTALSSAASGLIMDNGSIDFYRILGGMSAVSPVVESQLAAAIATN